MSLENVSSLQQFMTILKTSGKKLVVVDFHATWCGPCHAIAPFYEQLARRYAGRARFLKVDVDEAEDVARHCSVSSMPTFHLYLNGSLVSHFSGADQRRLEADVERHAPSSADVAFAGSGQKLGAAGSSSASAGAPKVDWNLRETAAAAAAKRMAAMMAASEPEAAKPEAAEPEAAEPEAAEPEAAESEKPQLAADASEGKAPAAGPASAGQRNDSRLKVNPIFLQQLVNEMGFPNIRAEKALILTGNRSVEQAVEWCFEHADDPDIDEPLQVVTKEGDAKPKLTPEEAKQKAAELYARVRAKRDEEDKKEAHKREKDRIKSGKEVTEAKQKYEEDARKRAVEEKKREKLEALRERQRVRAMLEADKLRRREKFNMPGSSKRTEEAPKPKPPAPKAPSQPSAAGGKIQFRLPDGSRIEGEFGPEQTMGDLITFLSTAKPELGTRTLMFSQQYPRRRFSATDYGSTLGDLNLLPRGALTVSFS